VWIGETNNMLFSWAQAAKIFNFNLNIASFCQEVNGMKGFENCKVFTSPIEACYKADLVTTDTMTSMGYSPQAIPKAERLKWKVSEEMMSLTNIGCVFLHCLPGYRGIEVSESIIDGTRSVVNEEVSNRLLYQVALLKYITSTN
jgi:ornithine carbamoyltransferase